MGKSYKRFLFLIAVLSVAIIFLCVFIARLDSKKLYMSLENKNELIYEDEYTINVQSNAAHADILINGEKKEIISCPDGDIRYTVNTKQGLLHEGWNYIQIVGYRDLPHDTLTVGGAINVLLNGPDVFVPDVDLFEARQWNQKNHMEPGYYEDFISNYTYSWNGAALEGRIQEVSEAVQYDKNGIPVAKYKEDYYYNPVTIAQNGLGWYNKYLLTDDSYALNRFLYVADYLVDAQKPNGSYPYTIPFAIKNLELPENFVSGMAQGQVLQVLIRAYDVKKDKKYLDAGYKALRFMLVDADDDIFSGCRKSLRDFTDDNAELQNVSDLHTVEEYVSDPSSYVLNGGLIALLGLYDWYQGAPEEYGSGDAYEAFLEAIQAFKAILPYYDYYGWTCYDLLQYTYDDSFPFFHSGYAHRVHIKHLHALYTITGDEELLHWRDVFMEYELDDFWRQTNQIYR